MRVYCLSQPGGEFFWVRASCEREARTLVASTVANPDIEDPRFSIAWWMAPRLPRPGSSMGSAESRGGSETRRMGEDAEVYGLDVERASRR
jgi:hypothetical protein